MIRLLLLVVGLPLLAIGGEGLYHAARSRQQTVMTCEQFARDRPKVAWIRLTDCDIDYIGAGYRESGGRISELLFPVRPSGQARNVPASMIVATTDPKALQIAENTIGGPHQSDQEAFLVMMLTIVTALKASRQVDGYVRVGLVDRLNARRIVSGLAGPIDPAFIVIDLHQQPPMLVPALETAAGAHALLVFLFLQVPRRGRVAGAKASEPHSSQAELPGSPASGLAGSRASDLPGFGDAPATATVAPAEASTTAPRRLRGLMLLNLAAEEGLESIEHAPPLGDRGEVLRKLGAALPGIRADENGRCTFNRPDYSVTIAIGPDDPVATAVVDTTGEASVAAVRSILHATGWRAFSPRRGAFIDADQLSAAAEPAP